jgi:glucosamine--fructose-6-phosphate aminotransferase (isomerizing)
MIEPQTSISHMAQELAQAPEVVARMLEHNRPALAEVGRLVRLYDPRYLVTSARGSSDHAASYLKYLSEVLLGMPCCSIGASVVSIYRTELRLRDTILVTISQSGKSPDILAFQDAARRAGVPALAITNDEASPLGRSADICLPLCAGPELSVAATKTFIASVTMAAALVATSGENRSLTAALAELPEHLVAALTMSWPDVEAAIASARSLYVLGRGPSLPIAQEAALKLKETCGLHAEGFSAAEVMHGPMELVGEGFPVLMLVPNDRAAASAKEVADRLRSAGAAVLFPLYRPAAHLVLDPISMIQTFYRSAEHIALRRGRDPDRPKLLQKVTQTL